MSARAARRAVVAAALAAALAALLAGCANELRTQLLPNQRPTVRLTHAPIDTTQEEFYVYRMSWTGFDPDGRVSHFEYAVDPPSAMGSDTAWVQTNRNEQIITFSATKPESLGPGQKPRSQGFHVFVLRAVDNRGMPSEPARRAFFSYGVAPSVQILSPRPTELLSPSVAPAARIEWEGKDYIDPNGYVFEKPVRYKYKLYKRGPGMPWDRWVQTPDSMRADVAPGFAGWDSCGPDTTSVQYTNLTPNSEYMFAIVAFGRSGAYSPIFTLNSNMLRMYVGFAGVLGPRITIFNSFFSYTYPSGGFPSPLDPSWAIQLQVPSARPLTFNWMAEAPAGSVMRRYRWVLDITNLDDETPRTSQNDWSRWSAWSLNETSATIGPFAGAGGDTGEVHNFYLEAEDINGLVSLGWVQFRVFKPTFAKPLLVVNDTRFSVDQVSRTQPPARTDSLQAPSGLWPTRAELDTFLFAVGGVRWRMTPTGRLSPAGVLRGYPYDTLGTRQGLENPTISLARLGQYRNVIWMTDLRASLLEGSPASNTQPMTTLLYMSRPNRQNTLATWVGQGGRLWGLGGGFANATNAPWNNLGNDTQVRVYRYDGARPDLTPGRFMYDLAHWRSEFRVFGNAMVRFARHDRPDPTVGYPPPAAYWRGGRWTDADVDYTPLPVTLQPRDPATDPIWPFRTPSDFYIGNPVYSGTGFSIEYITLENRIQERYQVPSPTDPDSLVDRNTLDSLYNVYGPAYQGPPPNGQLVQPAAGVNVVMTRYRGRENADMVFTGVDLWSLRRQDVVGLVDFVLGRLWGLSRSAGATVARSEARPTVVATPARGAPSGLALPPVGRGRTATRDVRLPAARRR